MTPAPGDRVQQRAALISATLASFLTPFLGSSINVALPAIGAQLGMNAVQLSWVATAFLLVSAVCLVPFGRLADMFGRKRVFVGGMVIFGSGCLACGLSTTAAQILAARAFQGVGAAMIFGTGLAILTAAFPANRRGRVIGLNSSAVYVGLSIGPFLGGLLTRDAGWASIFFAVAPIAALALIVACRGLRSDHRPDGPARIDAPGTGLYAAALVALMVGLSLLPGRRGLALVALGLVLAGGFVAWERRTPAPLLDVTLFANNAVFAWSNVAALINYSATAAVTFLLSLYLQYIRGFNPAEAGLVLLVQSVVMAATSPIAGRLSDRVQPRLVASAGMAVTVAGLLSLAFLDARTPLAAIVVELAVLGFGFGLFSSPNTNAVMSSVEKPCYGVASATLATMRLLGQTASMGLAAAVLAVCVGDAAITPATHGALLIAIHLVLALSAGVCVLGVVASLARGNLRRSAPSPIAGTRIDSD